MNRELPHNNAAEQAILGAMLVYPSVTTEVLDQGLLREDFYLDMHGRIFNAMSYLIDHGKPIDPTTLITRLSDTEELSLVGGADYIVSLCDSAISSANIVEYINIVQNKAYARRIILAAEEIVNEGFDGTLELDELIDSAEKRILDVTRKRKASNFKSSGMVVRDVINEIAALRGAKNHLTGIDTGYVDLDRITNGFQRGDLIILAARPSMGKTAFALNVALNSAERNDGAVAIFSLEMPAEQLMRRMLSAKSSIEGNKLRTGYFKNDEEFNRLNEAATEMAATKLFIDDSAVVKISDIFSKCRKLKNEHGLDLVLIDYLQLIAGSGKHSDNRQQEVSDISRSLKALARELNVPVIALSQLSRSVETRNDKRPMLSDLRESGAIEQDADIVMFLYRDDYYEKDEEKKNADQVETELDIQKHRNGAVGKIRLQFHKSVNAFYNLRTME